MKSSIIKFVSENAELKSKQRGLPSVGKNPILNSFSTEIEQINEAFKIYGNEIYKLDKIIDENLPKNSLGGGSPADFKPFPLCISYMKKSFKDFKYSEYPLASGEELYKKHVVGYLKKEKFIAKDYLNNISEDNVIFTTSTTQAFNYIIETICKPHDVIIMTAPNYGLFSFVPERHSVTVKLLELEEKDGYLPSPEKLDSLIININRELKEQYKDLQYQPQVVAFLNINPHNPLGTVLGENERDILYNIGRICKNRGVFIIDDLIYRDLNFKNEEKAKPMASLNGMFDNTITMFGLSKSYGLAGIRAGLVFANDAIIRGIRNCIFQQMDSPPLLQASALAGAFNATKERERIYKKYFNKINSLYLYRFNLLKALIEGIQSVENKYHNKIRKDVKRYIKDKKKIDELLQGIPNVKFVKGISIKAGFFVLIDFTELKGKSYKKYTINSEIDLLKYLYQYGRMKFIIGQSIGWSKKEQIIGRFTYALDEEKLITAMYYLNKLVKELK